MAAAKKRLNFLQFLYFTVDLHLRHLGSLMAWCQMTDDTPLGISVSTYQ